MIIYADNAATTKMSQTALDAMLPCFTEAYGNPSSPHHIGQEAAKLLIAARKTIADLIGAEPSEIIFTSGGSEADNQAIVTAAILGAKKGKKHIISTKIEHHAVLHTLKKLEKDGYEVTLLDVHENGIVRLEDLDAAIRPDTALVTIMYANNEIGTIQPIAEIGALCKEKGVFFHTDAVQAAGHLPVNVKEQNIDMLSLSAHKFHGPKGAGVLFVRRGIPITAIIEGGAQERGKRAGTENMPAIVGMAAAFKEACDNMSENMPKVQLLRDKLIDGLLKLDEVILNGDREKRLPGNVNVSVKGIEGESLLMMLDMQGICASSGSACTSGSLDPSHVLLAIGLIHEVAHGSLRISLSEYTTEEEVDYILEKLPPIVERLRNMSPVWKKMKEVK
ncbi:MAG: cysteine desulfurase NifS [Firmicutes bacterium HGW-Firmicutes-16]|nr:MAG: cysteine desulfurase NifS [Firmicutes bacterium HGW-Firmicutes-16]